MRVFKFIIRIILKSLPLILLPKLNVFLFSKLGYKIHHTAKIYSSVSIFGDIEVSIGSNTHIGNQSVITGGSASISIGSHCDISDRVSIICGTHEINKIGIKSAGKDIGIDIIIEDGVWIGYGAIILPGVKIGKKAIIGAGSVVNKNVEPNCIYAGNPAKFIRKI